MFSRLRKALRTIWFFFTFATMIVVGWLLFRGFLWLMQQPTFVAMAQNSTSASDFMGRLVTAVKIIAGLFFITWGLRFLDQFFLGNGLTKRLGFFTGGSFSLIRLFTYPFVHGDFTHLTSNTWPLLVFAGAAVLLLPTLSILLPVALFLFLVQGIGVWLFGAKGLQLGASGLVLGLFSFDVSHGLFAGSWKTAVAIALVLFFRRTVWYTLTSHGTLPNGAKISVAGHLWGFFSGIFAAYLISPFGPLSVY